MHLPVHIGQVKIQADALYHQHQYQAALDRYEQTFALLEQEAESLNLVWAEANVANNIGNMYKKLGQTTRARDWYHKSLERNPAHVQALYNLANLQLRLGDYGAATELFRNVLKIQPDLPEGLMGLASALRGADSSATNVAESTALLLRANELKPGDADVLANLGLTFLGEQQAERAVTYFQEAVELGHVGAKEQLQKILYALERVKSKMQS